MGRSSKIPHQLISLSNYHCSMIYSFTPFANLNPLEISLLVGINLFGFTVRGAFGFGAGLPNVLLMSLIVPPHQAVILHSTATLISQLQLLPQGVRDGDWQISKHLIFGFFFATIAGVLLFSFLNEDQLKISIGLLLLIIMLADLANILDRLSVHINLQRPSVPIFYGAFSGFIGAIAGGGTGYFLAAYLKWATKSPISFRGTNLLMAIFYGLWRFFLLVIAGWVGWQTLLNALILVPAVLLGGMLGRLLSQRLKTATFYRGVQLILILAAILLMAKGLKLFE